MKLSLRVILTCCLVVTVLTGASHLVLLQLQDQPNSSNHNGSDVIIHRFKRSRPAPDATALSRRRRGKYGGRFKATTYRPPSPVIQALQFDKIDIYQHYESAMQSTTTVPPQTDVPDRALPVSAKRQLVNEEEDEALHLTELLFEPEQHVMSNENNQEAASRSTVIPNIIPSEWQEEAINKNQPFQPEDVVWAPHLTQSPAASPTTPWPSIFNGDIHFEESRDADFYHAKPTVSTTARKYKQRPRYGGGYGPPPYHGGGYHRPAPVIVHPPPIIVDNKDKGHALKAFLLVFLIPLAIALALFVLFALAIGYAYTLAYVATILNSTNITYIYGLSGFSILPYFTSLLSGSSFAFASAQQQQQQQQSSNNNNNNNNANNNNNNNAIVINVTGRANQDDEMLIFRNPFKFAKFKDDEPGELMDDY